MTSAHTSPVVRDLLGIAWRTLHSPHRTGAIASRLALGALVLLSGCPRPGPETNLSSGGATSSTGQGGTTTSSGSTGAGGREACGQPADPPPAHPQRSVGGKDEWARGAAFGADGSLFVVGSYNGKDTHIGLETLPTLCVEECPPEATYLVRYSKYFSPAKVAAVFSTRSSRGSAVTVDSASGDIVVVGQFIGTMNIGGTTLSSHAGVDGDVQDPPDVDDVFVARFTSNLEPLWAKSFDAAGMQRAFEVAFDHEGQIIVTGATDGNSLDLGKGALGSKGHTSSFVAKLYGDGTCAWSVAYDCLGLFPHPGDDDIAFSTALAVGPDGDVLFGGSFACETYFGASNPTPAGGSDAFVVRLSTGGDTRWVQTLHGVDSSGAGDDGDQWITSIAVGPPGNDIETYDVYVAGAYTKSISWKDGADTESDSQPGAPQPDIFVAKLVSDPYQHVVAAHQTFHGSGWEEPSAVRVGPSDRVLLTGILQEGPGSLGTYFGPQICYLVGQCDSSPNVECDLTHTGAFIADLRPNGVGSWGYRFFGDADQSVFDARIGPGEQIAAVGNFKGRIGLSPTTDKMTATWQDMFVVWYDAALQ